MTKFHDEEPLIDPMTEIVDKWLEDKTEEVGENQSRRFVVEIIKQTTRKGDNNKLTIFMEHCHLNGAYNIFKEMCRDLEWTYSREYLDFGHLITFKRLESRCK